jgi:aminopeptidase N
MACGGSGLDVPDPEAGVPVALADDRAARLSNVRYDLTFAIPASASEPIAGTASIRFELKAPERPLILDFAPGADHLMAVTVSGKAAAYRTVKRTHHHFPAGVDRR